MNSQQEDLKLHQKGRSKSAKASFYKSKENLKVAVKLAQGISGDRSIGEPKS